MLKDMTVRFFVQDYFAKENGEPVFGVEEVEEHYFLEAAGTIEYERHTVRENGVSQICLTKIVDI